MAAADGIEPRDPQGDADPAAAGAQTWNLPLGPEAAVTDRRALMLMSIRNLADREPLAQEIFDEVAIDIVEGRLRPGDSLNSVDLSRRFGTSRTPVREALAELERHGVIDVPPRRRPQVVRPTLKQVHDVYVLRANLFSLVSELIVDSCPDEELAGLWKWQRALEDDVERDSVDDYFWHNVGFRLVEVSLSGNGELQRTLHTLGLRTLQFRHLSLSQPGQIRRSVADHHRLLRAYEERDKTAATGMTRALIMGGYRAIQRSGLITEAPPVIFGADAGPGGEAP
ncbi:MAG TPA: GntR family transcriptional regulator [Trebonia sp.]|nr:GntR family transcriptional regulator [Trebonia sp.]